MRPYPSHPHRSRSQRCLYPAEYGVRLSPFNSTMCSLLPQLPPRRAIRTAPSPGPADDAPIVGASTAHLAPLVPVSGDAGSGSTQLPTVRIYPNHPPNVGTSRDRMDLCYSLSLKRVNYRRDGGQTRASTPLPRWSRLLLMPRLRSPNSPSLTSTKPCLTRAILIVCSLARHSQGRGRRCKVSELRH